MDSLLLVARVVRGSGLFLDGIEVEFACFAAGGAFCTRLRPWTSPIVSNRLATHWTVPRVGSSGFVHIPPEPESSVFDVLEDDRDWAIFDCALAVVC